MQYYRMKEFWKLVKQNKVQKHHCMLGCLGISIVWLLQSCFSLQSSYPPITYYRLQSVAPKPVVPIQSGLIPGTLQMKKFSIDAEWESEQLSTISGTTVQPLSYHRWSSEPKELISAFVTNRILQSGIFSAGVITEETGFVPDYTIEGRITEMGAYNTGEQAPCVRLAIHYMLYHHKPGSGHTLLLQKTYEHLTRRQSIETIGIPPAFSESLQQITDSLMVDCVAILSVRR